MTVDNPRYTASSQNTWFKGKIDLDAKKSWGKDTGFLTKKLSKILKATHSHSDKGPQAQLVSFS